MGGAPVRPPSEAERKARTIWAMLMVPALRSTVRAFVPASTSASCREKDQAVDGEAALETTAEMMARWRCPRPTSPVGSDLRIRE